MLCKSIPEVEWSGILFYIVEGTIREPEKMKIIIKDIFLMDKGDKVSTGFDWDEDIVEYRMNNEESDEWIVGHIHSHNTMKPFFSSTDWTELNDNSPLHNMYLSLIVNNYMDMVAKVAFIGDLIQPKKIKQVFIAKDETGKDYKLKLPDIEPKKLNPTMFIYECEVIRTVEQVTVESAFMVRIKEVEKKAAEKIAKAAAEKANRAKSQPKPSSNKSHSAPHQIVPDYNGSNHRQPQLPYTSIEDALANWEAENDDVIIMVTPEDRFLAFVLRFGNMVKDDCPADALDDIETNSIPEELVALSIQQSYPAYYGQFYEKDPKFGTAEHFKEISDIILETLKIFAEEDYQWLDIVIEALENKVSEAELDLKEQIGINISETVQN